MLGMIHYMEGKEQTPLTEGQAMISWLEEEAAIHIYSNLILVRMLLMNMIL